MELKNLITLGGQLGMIRRDRNLSVFVGSENMVDLLIGRIGIVQTVRPPNVRLII
jgi:hypothetical protein